jgi:hypothetical protein
MVRIFGLARRRALAGIVLWIGVAALTAPSTLAASDKDYTKQPGYVDFDAILGDMESSVEVYLKGSLLVLAREAVKDEDPELSGILSKIEYVKVQVFPAHGASLERLSDKARDMAAQLEKKGWEMAVRVREEDEQIHVYLLPGKKDDIRGLVVMVVGDDDEAAFVNIVGDINPAEIARIGRAFHIDSMDVPIKVEVKGDAEVIVDDGKKEHKHTD